MVKLCLMYPGGGKQDEDLTIWDRSGMDLVSWPNLFSNCFSFHTDNFVAVELANIFLVSVGCPNVDLFHLCVVRCIQGKRPSIVIGIQFVVVSQVSMCSKL